MRFYSLITPVHEGFEGISISQLTKGKLLLDPVVVLSEGNAKLLERFKNVLPNVSGFFIEIRDQTTVNEFHEKLWLITIPASDVSVIKQILLPSMSLLTRLNLSEEYENGHKIELERIKRESKAMSADFKAITERLSQELGEKDRAYKLLGRQSEELRITNEALEQARIDAEQASEAKTDAEKASEAKGLFLATMSHEVRTPMNAVIGFMDLFDRSNLTDEQNKYLDFMHSSASLMIGLLDDLLDFSRIEADNIALKPEPISLHETIDAVMYMLADYAGEKGVQFATDISPMLPDRIFCDSGRLKQIITNLCTNGIKFASGHKEHGGLVLIRVDTTTEQDNIEKVRIEVEDDGIGISSDKIPGLFEPFIQADSSTRRKYGGTGLGLAICHKLIKKLGGEIDCQSQVGYGTCFTITLPLIPVDTCAIPLARENTAELALEKNKTIHANKIILIAEDNQVNQMVIKEQINKIGFKTVVVNDGAEALVYLNEHPVDILITDWHMPNIDGATLVKKIRAHEIKKHQRRLPIIALTANILLTSNSEAQQHVDDILMKPTNIAKLTESISKLLISKSCNS